jgi:hypothetical protein
VVLRQSIVGVAASLWIANVLLLGLPSASPAQPPTPSSSDVREAAYGKALREMPNPAAHSELGAPTPKLVFEGTTKDAVATALIGSRGRDWSYDVKVSGKITTDGRADLLSLNGLPAGGSAEVGFQRVTWNPTADSFDMIRACGISAQADLEMGYGVNAGGPYLAVQNEPVTVAVAMPPTLAGRDVLLQWTFHDGTVSFGRTASRTFTEPGIHQIKLLAKFGDVETRSSAMLVIGKTRLQGFKATLVDKGTREGLPQSTELNARYGVEGIEQLSGSFAWDRGDGVTVNEPQLAPFKFDKVMAGDPSREVAREVHVSFGYLDQNKAGAVLSKRVLVAPTCTYNNIKNNEAARHLMESALDWGMPLFWGARVGVGRTSFDYLDAAEAKQSVSHNSWSVTGASGVMFSTDTFLRFNFKYRREYDAGAKIETCQFKKDSVRTTTCEDLFQTAPTLIHTRIAELSLQHSLSERLALQPRVAYDFEKSAAIVSLPAYFLQDEKEGLSGGVEVGWRSDTKRYSVVVFIGAMLGFAQL